MAANHEPTVTYEGDNNVLVQQASNWILRQWSDIQSGTTLISPLSSVQFLIKGPAILNNKFNSQRQAVSSIECKHYKKNKLNSILENCKSLTASYLYDIWNQILKMVLILL